VVWAATFDFKACNISYSGQLITFSCHYDVTYGAFRKCSARVMEEEWWRKRTKKTWTNTGPLIGMQECSFALLGH